MFDLTVRFDPSHMPGWIRTVRGETVRCSTAPSSADINRINLDDSGEAHQRFPNPIMYLAYGIQWEQQAPGPGMQTAG